MADVLVVIVVVVVLVVGAALVARVTGRGGQPARRGDGAGTRSGPGSGAGPGAGADADAGPVGRRPVGGERRPGVPTAGSPPPAEGHLDDAEVIGPAVGRDAAPPGAPLAELLRGIELPCGLVPSTGGDHPDPAHYLALVTTGSAPDEVGPAMGDELERLGYQLHSLSEDEIIARRGDDLLSLRLHREAEEARLGGVALFPTAGRGTVAVELWTGGGPSPRTATP